MNYRFADNVKNPHASHGDSYTVNTITLVKK